jgi:peptidoglycan hydrolase-like protein with peptidoglycan-binding domain
MTNGAPDLGWGDSGEWVTYLQQMLNHYYEQDIVPETGEFDDTTANVVQHFREQHGLPDGSTVDYLVWEKLLA